MADQTSASVEIAAPVDQILAVIADFESYPEWVDWITAATVLTVEQSRPRTVRMRLEHPFVRDEYVVEFDWQTDGVTWQLVEGGFLQRMDGSYRLVQHDGGTRVTYTLAVAVNLPMIGMVKRKAEKTIVDGALQGLKKRVEN